MLERLHHLRDAIQGLSRAEVDELCYGLVALQVLHCKANDSRAVAYDINVPKTADGLAVLAEVQHLLTRAQEIQMRMVATHSERN